MPRPMDVYEELVHLRRSGQKAALATIVEVQGSIPSAQSAKLLVREDGSMVGTIGGGCTERSRWHGGPVTPWAGMRGPLGLPIGLHSS